MPFLQQSNNVPRIYAELIVLHIAISTVLIRNCLHGQQFTLICILIFCFPLFLIKKVEYSGESAAHEPVFSRECGRFPVSRGRNCAAAVIDGNGDLMVLGGGDSDSTQAVAMHWSNLGGGHSEKPNYVKIIEYRLFRVRLKARLPVGWYPYGFPLPTRPGKVSPVSYLRFWTSW